MAAKLNVVKGISSQQKANSLKLTGPGKANASATATQYLRDAVCLVVEQGLGKTRASILEKQLIRHGGVCVKQVTVETKYVLVGNSVKLEKLLKTLKIKENDLRDDIKILRADWLSSCLKEGKLVEVSPFSLRKVEKEHANASDKELEKEGEVDDYLSTQKPSVGAGAEPSMGKTNFFHEELHETVSPYEDCLEQKSNDSRKRKRGAVGESNDSDYINSDDEKTEELSSEDDVMNKPAEIAPHISPHKKTKMWICTKPSSSRQENVNEYITEKLEVLEKVYKNTNDQWRALGYKKAISSIKNYPKRIETLEECKSLPFVGERLANKVWEIIQTGHLQRLDHLDSKTDAIDLFCNLWGAGPKSAENWVAKGLKTLEDLKEHGNLNRQQLVGLKYYDEFLERMPRSEAEEIGRVVTESAHSINPGLECVICGSFRRGKRTCGDVDVLVSHPDGRSHQGVMPRLLDALKETGFLTDDLTLMDNRNQRKYLGVCLLPGKNKKVFRRVVRGESHRRIDIIVVPYSEWACALVYFTGSDYLNRSMRLLARKKGMSLSEHSLNTGVIRKGQERLAEGTALPVSSERDIFQYLGLDYLEPQDRDW